MAAKNYLGMAERIYVAEGVGIAVQGGDPVVAGAFHGVAQTAAGIDLPFTMHIEGEFDLALIDGAAQGDLITIKDADFTLALVAQGATAAAAAGARKFGIVTRIPPGTASPGVAPAAGRMWVKLLPPGNVTTGA